jgi:hypothetical protein
MLVLLFGWLTELRGVMHALLITLCAHAFVPFVVVLTVVAVLSAAALSTALMAEEASGGSAARATLGTGRLARAYDEHIRRQRRHPLAWGAAAGLGLGLVGVWLVLAALVVPLETRTLGVLLLAQARLDGAARGAVSPGAAGPGGATPVLDAFGRAVTYQTDAAGAPRGLRSLGLDGVPSGDDLCVAPQSTTVAHDPLAFLESLRDGQLGWSAQVGALARARSCFSVH